MILYKVLQDSLDYSKQNFNLGSLGLTFQDISVNKNSLVVTYADASWSNAGRCTLDFTIGCHRVADTT